MVSSLGSRSELPGSESGSARYGRRWQMPYLDRSSREAVVALQHHHRLQSRTSLRNVRSVGFEEALAVEFVSVELIIAEQHVVVLLALGTGRAAFGSSVGRAHLT